MSSPENKEVNLDSKEIEEIVTLCVKNLYNNKGLNSRTQKNQKPDTMLQKVLTNDITTVGLYSRLPDDLRFYIDDKKSKHLFNTDSDLRKRMAEFLLKYDDIYTTTYCCFMTKKAREALTNVLHGERTRFPFNVRTWFNVSERQIFGKRINKL